MYAVNCVPDKKNVTKLYPLKSNNDSIELFKFGGQEGSMVITVRNVYSVCRGVSSFSDKVANLEF